MLFARHRGVGGGRSRGIGWRERGGGIAWERRSWTTSLRQLGARHGIPTDPGVAVFEALAGSGPTEDGDERVVACFPGRVGKPLPDDVSGGTVGFKVVLRVEDRPELADFKWLGRGANVEGGIGLHLRGEGDRGTYDSPTLQNRGDLSGEKAVILVCWRLRVCLPSAMAHHHSIRRDSIFPRFCLHC